jgi:hypothetical protein
VLVGYKNQNKFSSVKNTVPKSLDVMTVGTKTTFIFWYVKKVVFVGFLRPCRKFGFEYVGFDALNRPNMYLTVYKPMSRTATRV